MKLVVFGLAISSSWGNGHATLWRGLVRALAAEGVRTVFYEHDVPYYAANRDLRELPGGEFVLYPDWEATRARAAADLRDADVAMVTSFCPHGVEATTLVLESCRGLRCFYDLDTPVTLSNIEAGRTLSYIGSEGLAGFDLVFSYTGGAALAALRDRLGARQVEPLYGHVDPAVHRHVDAQPHYRADLSYLGTWSADRQAGVKALFVNPARRFPGGRFVIGGAQYPIDFPWTENIHFVRHLPPSEHPAFFSSSRLTLNVTREAMAAMGWCPSGRLFEAAACGTPILSDAWDGLEAFFTPGEEILTGSTSDDALGALSLTGAELARIAGRARDRVLAEHTSAIRAAQMLASLEAARDPAVAA